MGKQNTTLPCIFLVCIRYETRSTHTATKCGKTVSTTFVYYDKTLNTHVSGNSLRLVAHPTAEANFLHHVYSPIS